MIINIWPQNSFFTYDEFFLCVWCREHVVGDGYQQRSRLVRLPLGQKLHQRLSQMRLRGVVLVDHSVTRHEVLDRSIV